MKNPNLLDVVLLKPEGGKGKELVLEELPVNPELAPYLVTSLQAVTWVPNASKHNTVRAGVRDRRQHHGGHGEGVRYGEQPGGHPRPGRGEVERHRPVARRGVPVRCT